MSFECKIQPNKQDQPFFFFQLPAMARGEHDRPDPTLILHEPRRVQPSKRGLGIDYPRTPLEELNERNQGKRLPFGQGYQLTQPTK
jgi:hypothetical protein